MSVEPNPPCGAHRIVFRHRGKTIDVFDNENADWFCQVQGDERPSGPFQTSGEAVEAGIKGAEHKVRRNASRKKKPKGKKPTSSKAVINKYIRGL